MNFKNVVRLGSAWNYRQKYFCSKVGDGLTKTQFLQKWEYFKIDFCMRIDEINSENIDDVNESDEVVKVKFVSGKTFVLNRMTPLSEIWLSSPVSGPTHFTYIQNKDQWIGPKGDVLEDLLWNDQQKFL